MKLNKQQLDALTNKIYIELQTEINKKKSTLSEKLIKATSKEINLLNKKLNLLNTLQNEILEMKVNLGKKAKIITNYNNSNFYTFYNEFNKRVTVNPNLKELNYINFQSIKNEIILNTIECKNLDDIIKTVKDKFKI